MQGRKKESKVIGGLKYDVVQLGGVDARNALLRMTKCIGPSIGAGVSGDIPGIFAKLALSEEDLAYFCDTFGASSFVHLGSGQMPRIDKVFDDHFAGRMGAMMQWLQFATEVNFSDFLGEARSKIGLVLVRLGLVETKPSASKSPKDSTGSSGDSSPTSDSASPSES